MALIYYIEDKKSIDQIIKKTIEHAGLTGFPFQNKEDLFEKYKQQKPDMILLDVVLQGVSGLDILKHIREYDNETPIILISALQSEMDKVIALDLGADDYMTKPFGVIELASRIQSKLRVSYYDQIYKWKNIILDDKKHLCSINSQEIYLTNKEYSIIKLLLKNRKDIVTKETIFKDIWETDFIGETRTLDMHIKSLRQKLKDKNAEPEIKTIRGIGYMIE